jgi:hypothetical protein
MGRSLLLEIRIVQVNVGDAMSLGRPRNKRPSSASSGSIRLIDAR